jgi:hypothetical protein
LWTASRGVCARLSRPSDDFDMEGAVWAKAGVVWGLDAAVLEEADIAARMGHGLEGVGGLPAAFAVFDHIELTVGSAWAVVKRLPTAPQVSIPMADAPQLDPVHSRPLHCKLRPLTLLAAALHHPPLVDAHVLVGGHVVQEDHVAVVPLLPKVRCADGAVGRGSGDGHGDGGRSRSRGRSGDDDRGRGGSVHRRRSSAVGRRCAIARRRSTVHGSRSRSSPIGRRSAIARRRSPIHRSRSVPRDRGRGRGDVHCGGGGGRGRSDVHCGVNCRRCGMFGRVVFARCRCHSHCRSHSHSAHHHTHSWAVVVVVVMSVSRHTSEDV